MASDRGIPPVKPGDILAGKYKVERILGSGGMGMVVAARHIELGQRVALKFMLPDAAKDANNVERFSREAGAAAKLQSEHTAKVSDVGKLKTGEPYMVMEYLEGRDLGDLLEDVKCVPYPTAIDLIMQACEAIAEAHALGIVHRDLKPRNLFLSHRIDGRPIVKVLDFGLAKTFGGEGEVGLTQTSTIFGSPQYMSPEQMRSAKDADSRSDIWALGVTLYELVAGAPPFDAPTLPELCAAVLKDELVPIRKVKPEVPPALESVIARCLQKDPAKRFQSVTELTFALEEFAPTRGSADRIWAVVQATHISVSSSNLTIASSPAFV